MDEYDLFPMGKSQQEVCKAKSSFVNPLGFSEGIKSKWIKASCFKAKYCNAVQAQREGACCIQVRKHTR